MWLVMSYYANFWIWNGKWSTQKGCNYEVSDQWRREKNEVKDQTKLKK